MKTTNYTVSLTTIRKVAHDLAVKLDRANEIVAITDIGTSSNLQRQKRSDPKVLKEKEIKKKKEEEITSQLKTGQQTDTINKKRQLTLKNNILSAIKEGGDIEKVTQKLFKITDPRTGQEIRQTSLSVLEELRSENHLLKEDGKYKLARKVKQ